MIISLLLGSVICDHDGLVLQSTIDYCANHALDEGRMNVKETTNGEPLPGMELKTKQQHVTIVTTRLVTAIAELHDNLPTDDSAISSMAELIVDSMTMPNRVYHSMQHIFDIVEDVSEDGEENPILILAALFHDVIYLNVDRDLSTAQAEILSNILVQDTDDDKSLALQIPVTDPSIDMVRQVFGFDLRPGQGYNEYLSALLAVRVLSPYLSMKHLIQLTACIEASIPFRPLIDSSTPMECLYERLEHTNQESGAGLSELELVETVRMAAAFSNCDLGSFCQTDPSVFLSNTWKLLPEWKPALLSESCRLQDLYDAFLLLHERYRQTDVELIFQHFRGFPAASDLDDMRQRARENLSVVGEYISLRLLQMRVLLDLLKVATNDPEQAIATTTKDAFTFIQQVDAGIDQQLTARPNQLSDDSCWNDQVYFFLTKGRQLAFGWDAAASPLSAFLYTQLSSHSAVASGNRLLDTQSEIHPAVALGNRLSDCNYGVIAFLPASTVNHLVVILSDVLPEFAVKWKALVCLSNY
jgi:hypothetical protein